jgi:serine/threonine protein kinase
MPDTTVPDTYELQERYKPDWFIDFAPGHYARVFSARDYLQNVEVAFKLLRPEHMNGGGISREFQAFGVEARLLQAFERSDQVVDLYDCGFISDVRGDLPASGRVASFGTDVEAFSASLERYHRRGWRPYLSEALMPEPDNLFVKLRENGQQRRRRLPTEEGLALCLQYGELLEEAHKEEIVYLDAKLEHFYWDSDRQRLCVIDWNSSKALTDDYHQDLDPEKEKRDDIRNFVLGVMYTLFTGMPFQGERIVAQPTRGDRIEARYQDAPALDFLLEPTLANSLQEIMEAGYHGAYTNAGDFLQNLKTCAREHGWPVDGRRPSGSAARMRKEIRAGLRALRGAQLQLQYARERFMAACQANPNDQEAQRLLKETQDFFDHRAIP